MTFFNYEGIFSIFSELYVITLTTLLCLFYVKDDKLFCGVRVDYLGQRFSK